MRAIIMSFPDDATAVIMTPHAGFEKIARTETMQLGERIDIPATLLDGSLTQLRARRRLRTRTGAFGAVAGLFLVAFLSLSQLMPAFAKPTAYLSIDINPSIQFSVSNQNIVLGVAALDSDGGRALEGLHLVHLPIKTAVKRYLQKIATLGYLHALSSVIVTSTPGNHVASTQLQSLLALTDASIRSTVGKRQVFVASFIASPSLWRLAQRLHVSPGRLAFYVEARRRGLHVSWREIESGALSPAVGGREVANRIVQTVSSDKTLSHVLTLVTAHLTQNATKNTFKNAVIASAPPLPPLPPIQVPSTTRSAPGSRENPAGHAKDKTGDGKTRPAVDQAKTLPSPGAGSLQTKVPAILPALPPMTDGHHPGESEKHPRGGGSEKIPGNSDGNSLSRGDAKSHSGSDSHGAGKSHKTGDGTAQSEQGTLPSVVVGSITPPSIRQPSANAQGGDGHPKSGDGKQPGSDNLAGNGSDHSQGAPITVAGQGGLSLPPLPPIAQSSDSSTQGSQSLTSSAGSSGDATVNGDQQHQPSQDSGKNHHHHKKNGDG